VTTVAIIGAGAAGLMAAHAVPRLDDDHAVSGSFQLQGGHQTGGARTYDRDGRHCAFPFLPGIERVVGQKMT